jgi:hypothetical protein
MKRWLAFSLPLAISVAAISAQDPSADSESFEVEPPLLVQPDGRPVAPNELPAASPTSARDVSQLEKQLERAKKSAASAERLWKAGVLAKMEAEQRTLRVVRLVAEFSKAQLAQVQEQIAASGPTVQAGQVDQSASPELKAALEQATFAAKTAAANLAKAELDAAMIASATSAEIARVG